MGVRRDGTVLDIAATPERAPSGLAAHLEVQRPTHDSAIVLDKGPRGPLSGGARPSRFTKSFYGDPVQ